MLWNASLCHLKVEVVVGCHTRGALKEATNYSKGSLVYKPRINESFPVWKKVYLFILGISALPAFAQPWL